MSEGCLLVSVTVQDKQKRRQRKKKTRSPFMKKSNKLEGICKNRTHDLRIRSTVTLPTELRGRAEKVGDDLGGESRRRERKGTYECCAA